MDFGQIERHGGGRAKTALFTFGSYARPDRSGPSYAFMKTCRRVRRWSWPRFDVWYFLANANDWYLGGVRHLTGDFESSAARIAEAARLYNRVAFVGNSMGAYAAAAFGAMAGASRVLAIAPQTRFDSGFREAIGDHRWADAMAALQARHDVAHYRLASLLARAPMVPPIHLLVGAQCAMDCSYADELAAIPAVRIEKVPDGDHNLAHALRASGRLDRLVRQAIAPAGS